MKKIILLFLPFLFSCNSKSSADKFNTQEFTHQSSRPLSKEAREKVVKVADGDTFTYLTSDLQQEKIRLHGIDAPEKAQDFGSVARKRLSDLIFGKVVRIERKDTDRYGRTIAIVYTEEGICVNEQLLKEGLVWHYKKYDNNSEWAKFEEKARISDVGLWSHPAPTPPWDFRRAKRSNITVE